MAKTLDPRMINPNLRFVNTDKVVITNLTGTNIQATVLNASDVVVTDINFPATGGNILNDVELFGNLTVLGSITATGTDNLILFSTTTTTTALSIVNLGIGTALDVNQNSSEGPVATFKGNDLEVLRINNTDPDSGQSGVIVNYSGTGNTFVVNRDTKPNALVVNNQGNTVLTGTLSAKDVTGDLLVAIGGTSNLWNQAYHVATVVQSNSATWEETADIIPAVTNYLSGGNVVAVRQVSAIDSIVTPRLITTGLTAINSNFQNVTATNSNFQNVVVNNLQVTSLTALSSILQVTDIQIYETSGFDVLGNVNVSNNITSNTINTNTISTTNANIATLITPNVNSVTSTLTAANVNAVTLTSTNILINDNGSITGATSATTFSIGNLSARQFSLVHTPANDGIDPTLDIGETGTEGFSGIRIRYDEVSNDIFITSRTGTTILTSAIIDVVTGQVGIAGNPATNQTLTVNGSISAAGQLTVGPGTAVTAPVTILSGSLASVPIPGSINRSQFGFFATPASTQRGIIMTPQVFQLNADRAVNGGNTTGLFSLFEARCDLAPGKYGYQIVFNITRTGAGASAIQYAVSATSGTLVSHYYQVVGNTAALPVTTLQPANMMSNYVTTLSSTAVSITPAGAALANQNANAQIVGVLDVGTTLVGFNPLIAQNPAPGDGTGNRVKAGSYIMIWPLGSASNSNVSVGNWY
jgi:hypothetical protein